MRLITKKCPNCGASLSFDENASKIKCEYCKQTIFIERDKKQTNQMSDEDYQLSLEMFNHASNIFKRSSLFAQIFVLIFFVIVAAILIFGFSTKFLAGSSQESNSDYITTLSQMDGNSLNLLQQDSLTILNSWTNNIFEGKVTAWEYIGMYLLVSKETTGNEIYMVYKRKHTVNSKQIEMYGAVSYTNIKLENGNISDFLIGSPVAPMKIENSLEMPIFGYESNEEFYNIVINPKKDQYEVIASQDLFI